MADKQPMVMFAASYDTVPAALEALDDIERADCQPGGADRGRRADDRQGVSKALETPARW